MIMPRLRDRVSYRFTWVELKDNFIVQYLGKRQLLKYFGTVDHIKQMSDESLRDFYMCFTKELVSNYHIITGGDNIRTFVRAIKPKVPPYMTI